jgi:hypothetical protein
MRMTKFLGENDPGYVNVCDVLWLWISTIEEKKKNSNDSIAGDPAGSTYGGYGPVYSGGGSVFIGSNNAGRDITNMSFGS